MVETKIMEAMPVQVLMQVLALVQMPVLVLMLVLVLVQSKFCSHGQLFV